MNRSAISLEMSHYNIDLQKKLYYMIKCLSFINATQAKFDKLSKISRERNLMVYVELFKISLEQYMIKG